MSMCKYCDSDNHTALFCPFNPKMFRGYEATVTKDGKKYSNKGQSWKSFQKEYKLKHPPNHEGYYECYLCHEMIPQNAITLDHVIPKSRGLKYAFDETNLKFCCWPCNTEKGSQVYENNK